MPDANKDAAVAKSDSTTKSMFDCLAKLYKQGQLLLMDADRLMGERGWEPMDTRGPGRLPMSLNSPRRWYTRWAVRFYMPTATEDEEAFIDRILFASIHFASDHDTTVDEPIVSAGRLLYTTPMSVETAKKSYYFSMCKYWFKHPPLEAMEGWCGWRGQGQFCPNMKAAETFKVQLYDIASSAELERLVIGPLLAVENQA